ncbi:sugar phosphate isomerase/epimerase family protein [Paenibacillus eucommiae]|uniref:Sugar phosphate isomerase/epimerase n=1 Tax=Paenibacillus eucommiae TaxID=1355755 RepID=A0ABS4J510_9BACL|nr:sugar phosphate isomerase/epimerase [Paenibacillus eucommiae]MBP1994924.1 sugar phosphate isomerase/epimerase [Paenibacillus eucommiae]
MNVPFERALEGISRAGYRNIAFGLPHVGMEVPSGNDTTSLIQLQRLFDRYGVEPIMLIGTNQLAPGMPLEEARHRLETAKTLGVKEVVSLGACGYHKFPDLAKPVEELESEHKRFVDKYREIGFIAESLGITVSLKPHTGNTATARHLLQTLEEIGSSSIKASYDPGNVHYYEGIRSELDFPIIAAQTISLIAKDHRGSRANHNFPIPGEGDVDFPALFRTWHRSGMSGSVVVERVDGDTTSPFDPEQIDERIAKARINLQRLLKETGLEVS